MADLKKTSVDGIKRLVIWQPASGFVVDLARRNLLKGGSPKFNYTYFNAGNGSDYIETVDRITELTEIDNDLIRALRVMRNVGCPVCYAQLSWSKSVLWLDPTNLTLTPNRPGFPGHIGEVLRIRNNNFFAPIYDVQNLVAGFPWHCAEAEPILDEAGDPTGTYRLHYNYPDADFGWIVTGGDGVSQYVDAAGVLQQGTATLEFQFPVANAQIRIFTLGTFEALDFAGNVLDTTVGGTIQGGEITLPYLTWSIRVTVESGESLPEVIYVDSGAPVSPRLGVCVVCEDPGVIVPPWTELNSTIETENLVPPEAESTIETANLVPQTEEVNVTIETENLGLSSTTGEGVTIGTVNLVPRTAEI